MPKWFLNKSAKQFSGWNRTFQQFTLEQLGTQSENNQINISPHIKINTEWVKDIKGKVWNFEKNIGKNIWDLKLSREFLDNTMSMIHKRKTNYKLDIIKIENFAPWHSVKRIKKPSTGMGEKISTYPENYHTSNT